jgi:phage terminase large subunit-like protein
MADLVMLPGQLRLWQCPASYILYCAGVGSGKTQGGARWSFKQIAEQPYAKGFIGANTFNQLHQVCIPAFKALLEEVGLEYVFNKRPPADWGPSRFEDHDGIASIRVPGCELPCQIHTGSMENYLAHRGKDFGWYWLDEARDMEEEAYNIVQSRLRGAPKGTRYCGILTTTPNGFGWIHKKYVAEPIPDSAVIRAKTTENPYLPPGFVENLRAQYTALFARQEIDGEFLNLTAGAAYHAFKRTDHVAPVKVNPRLPMFYAMDWNISPLCAVYGQGDKLLCGFAGEIYIAGSGRTADAADEFCRRNQAHECKEVSIYGDQSGANQSTRGDSTDYDILERVMRANGWSVEIHRNYKNPGLVESVESVNAAFEHMRATVDPSCKRLITDLEQCSWKEGTRILDKSNSDLTHLSDAARYYLYKEFSAGQQVSATDILN